MNATSVASTVTKAVQPQNIKKAVETAAKKVAEEPSALEQVLNQSLNLPTSTGVISEAAKPALTIADTCAMTIMGKFNKGFKNLLQNLEEVDAVAKAEKLLKTISKASKIEYRRRIRRIWGPIYALKGLEVQCANPTTAAFIETANKNQFNVKPIDQVYRRFKIPIIGGKIGKFFNLSAISKSDKLKEDYTWAPVASAVVDKYMNKELLEFLNAKNRQMMAQQAQKMKQGL